MVYKHGPAAMNITESCCTSNFTTGIPSNVVNLIVSLPNDSLVLTNPVSATNSTSQNGVTSLTYSLVSSPSWGSAERARGVPEWLLTGIQVYLGLVAVCGSFGNMLTLIAVAVNKRLQNVMMVYVCNLAMADWLVCSVLIPVALYTYKHRLRDDVCQAIGFLNLLLLMVSVFSLALISINRYVLVCKSRAMYTRWYTPSHVLISIVLVWVIAIVIFMPPFLGFGKFGYNARFGTCLFKHPDHLTYLFVIILPDGLAIFPTVNITIYCYVKILLKFKESRKRVQSDQPPVRKF